MAPPVSFLMLSKWVWIAVDRSKKQYIDFVIGGGDNKTGEKLYEKLSNEEISIIYTDYYKSYKSIISKEKEHIQSKYETYTVEGYSIFRHFLARIRGKTKCYSKCVKMLEYSIRLLMTLLLIY